LDDLKRIREIISRITEHYESPIRVGSRVEANVFYRVEYLSPDELDELSEYVAERVIKVCQPMEPEVIISLPGTFTGLAKALSRQLGRGAEGLEVVNVEQLTPGNGRGAGWLRGMNAVMVNDVITTARSCLEAHTRATVLGATVLCWAALIDRTFGPGPCPVVASFTGEPVRLLEHIS
jgi:orotate phosphoribosyltransferase